MITEDYVSSETAYLLGIKGFNEVCFKYTLDGKIYDYDEGDDGEIGVPTIQMAMKWLRKVHNIWIEVSPEGKGTWFVDVYDLSNEEYFGSKKFHHISSYEEACEEGIKYCLENLI